MQRAHYLTLQISGRRPEAARTVALLAQYLENAVFDPFSADGTLVVIVPAYSREQAIERLWNAAQSTGVTRDVRFMDAGDRDPSQR